MCGTGEPEFQVRLRISLFDLLLSGKEDLDGISLHWGFCLRAAELGLLLLGCAVSFLLTPLLLPPSPLPLYTRSEDRIYWKDVG